MLKCKPGVQNGLTSVVYPEDGRRSVRLTYNQKRTFILRLTHYVYILSDVGAFKVSEVSRFERQYIFCYFNKRKLIYFPIGTFTSVGFLASVQYSIVNSLISLVNYFSVFYRI